MCVGTLRKLDVNLFLRGNLLLSGDNIRKPLFLVILGTLRAERFVRQGTWRRPDTDRPGTASPWHPEGEGLSRTGVDIVGFVGRMDIGGA